MKNRESKRGRKEREIRRKRETRKEIKIKRRFREPLFEKHQEDFPSFEEEE